MSTIKRSKKKETCKTKRELSDLKKNVKKIFRAGANYDNYINNNNYNIIIPNPLSKELEMKV